MVDTAQAPAPEGRFRSIEDIKLIYKAAGNINFLLSLPTLSIPAVLSKLTESLSAPIDMWKLFAQTWPLSLSVAIVGVGFVGHRKHAGLVEALVLFSLALGITSWIGGTLGLPGAVPIEWWKLVLWPIYIVLSPGTVGRLVDSYFDFYGPIRFFSSVAVGAFLAWFWGTRILPRFETEMVVSQADREKLAAALRDLQAKRAGQRATEETGKPPGPPTS